MKKARKRDRSETRLTEAHTRHKRRNREAESTDAPERQPEANPVAAQMKEVAALFRSARRRLGIVLARKVGALGDPSRRTPRPPRPQPLHEAAALGAAEAPLATRGSSAPRQIYAEQFAQATGPDRTRSRRLISRAALETPGGTPMERPGRLGHCSSSHMRHVRRVNLAAPAGASGWSCSFWPGRIGDGTVECGSGPIAHR